MQSVTVTQSSLISPHELIIDSYQSIIYFDTKFHGLQINIVQKVSTFPQGLNLRYKMYGYVSNHLFSCIYEKIEHRALLMSFICSCRIH